MSTSVHPPGVYFDRLPPELLYEIQLFSLSESFPYTSRFLHQIFRDAPNSFRASYVIARISINLSNSSGEGAREEIQDDPANLAERAVRYPICTQEVFAITFQRRINVGPTNGTHGSGHLAGGTSSPDSGVGDVPTTPTTLTMTPGPSTPIKGLGCELPKRLFRNLAPKKGSLSKWRDYDQPLPFLRHLLDTPGYPPFDVNSNSGYALIRAVHAQFIPLISFLLEHGASPMHKKGLAVTVAIRQRNLPLVKMLIEREDHSFRKEKQVHGKRRRLQDRIEATGDMLKAARNVEAWDIVNYLMNEKGVVPDIMTLSCASNVSGYAKR
ncbi:hypothetical protein BDN72DRAFT_832455 [Pluteus cervinus]|uniref:Uncharacterized protein n=1 Tax=Pluteus cervinus TaxID=181527 RepID=A0ACD3BAU3_9AGAR|nr:hypothetical protein BDN72DRAFT_832455 [Pluteus cervinus]